MAMPSRARLLSETYAASSQRDAISTYDEGWFYRYIGRLRLDLVGFHQVVLPDSHLFDGLVFLRSDPSVVLEQIQRVAGSGSSPLVIKARQPTLDLALRDLLIRDDHLNRFPFKALLDDELSSTVATLLRNTPRASLDAHMRNEPSAAHGLASFLRSLTAAEGLEAVSEIEQMEAGWARWIEAEQRGDITVEVWDRPYNLPSGLSRAYLDHRETARVQPIVGEVRRLLEGESAYRGDLTALLAEHSGSLSAEERTEIDIVEAWARQVRYWALAEQHGCSLRTRLHSADPSQGRFSSLIESTSNEPEVDLPIGMIDRLGRLDSGAFRQALDTSALAAWWERHDPSDLRRAVARLATVVDSEVPAERRWNESLMEVLVDLTTTGFGAAAGGIAGASVGDLAGATIGAAGGARVGMYMTAYGRRALVGDPPRKVVRELVEYVRRPYDAG